MKKRAFTTIELLAVVSILTILLTIYIGYVKIGIKKAEERIEDLENNYECVIKSIDDPTIKCDVDREKYEDQIESDIEEFEDLIEDLESEVK